MLVYLRHGDDRGEDVYRHDRPLNERGRKQAGKEAQRLIDKLGHPDVVHASPFRRAQQTLMCMRESFERQVETHCDSRIAQRLSEKQRKKASLHPETLALINLDEEREAFRRRVGDHVREVRDRIAKASNLNIWAITHQGIIEEVARQFRVKIDGDLGFLDYVIMLR